MKTHCINTEQFERVQLAGGEGSPHFPGPSIQHSNKHESLDGWYVLCVHLSLVNVSDSRYPLWQRTTPVAASQRPLTTPDTCNASENACHSEYMPLLDTWWFKEGI